jgi:RNA polymerase sigma factor (TIGR02999 family)
MFEVARFHYASFPPTRSGLGYSQAVWFRSDLSMSAEREETTKLLRAWAAGDKVALEELTPRIYKELRQIAGRFMKNERRDPSIQATALVHEAYLRLVDVNNVDWQHRAHFFGVSAQIMRRILFDRARRRVAAKRGAKAGTIDLDQVADMSSERAAEVVKLDDALRALAKVDARKAQVVELRFFGGLTVEETGSVLGISPQTVMRDWTVARAWLLAELNG